MFAANTTHTHTKPIIIYANASHQHNALNTIVFTLHVHAIELMCGVNIHVSQPFKMISFCNRKQKQLHNIIMHVHVCVCTNAML